MVRVQHVSMKTAMLFSHVMAFVASNRLAPRGVKTFISNLFMQETAQCVRP